MGWETLIGLFGPWALKMLFPDMFGGGDPRTVQQTEQVTETPPRGYQSPLLGAGDMTMMDQLLRNMQMYSGAGMPGGQWNISPMVSQLLALIGQEGPKLIDQMGTRPTDAAGNVIKRRVA